MRTGWYDMEFVNLEKSNASGIDKQDRSRLYAKIVEIRTQAIVLPIYRHHQHFLTHPYVNATLNNFVQGIRLEEYLITNTGGN
jgi:ABC-type oligopeptide transport system substrate-binding subunit